MTSSQRRARRQNLLLKRKPEAEAAAVSLLPEVSVDVINDVVREINSKPVPSIAPRKLIEERPEPAVYITTGGTITAPEASAPVPANARAIARGLRGQEV